VPSELLRFACFELDLGAFELRKRGARVHLQAQPLRLLALLASRAGELVSRDEVRRHLWGDDTYVEWEQGIAYALRQVRRALGDSARTPRFVETVAGQGLRFLAPVSAASAATPTATTAPPLPRRPRLRATAALAVLGLATVAALVAVRPPWRDPSPTRPYRPEGLPRLVVEPLRPFGPDELHAPVAARALTEQLVTELIRRHDGRQLEVLAPARSVDAGTTGARGRLEASHRVVGSLRIEGSRVRLTARLVEEASGRSLWANSYERWVVDDIADLEGELARSLATALGLALRAEATPRSVAATEAGRAAAGFRLHQARALAATAERPRLEEARERLRMVLTLDPTAAPAYLELARVELQLEPPAVAIPQARDLLEQALALDDQLAEAHLELGQLVLTVDLDAGAARWRFQQAVAASPDLAAAHHALAVVDSLRGRDDEALATVRRALSLNPRSASYATDACWFAYFARRYALAVAEAQLALGLQPAGSEPVYSCWILAEMLRGRKAAALEPARRHLASRGATAELTALAGTDPDRALEIYWTWRRSPAGGPHGATFDAVLHQALGDTERAIATLQEHLAEGPDLHLLFTARDPLFAGIDDPRFQLLRQKLAALAD
jgi:DNA-binding winged helix-turn-helix (wHTH) protein/TolB-like protein